VIGMVGLIPDLSKIVGQGWQQTGDLIYLLGNNNHNVLGGSEYLATIHQTVAGQPPSLDFELEKKVQAACRHGIRQGWLNSAHDCAEGGLAVALAESSISGNLGAEIVINTDNQRLDELLFGESASRIIVSVHPQHQTTWENYLQETLDNNWQKLGVVGSSFGNLSILNLHNTTLIDSDVVTIKEIWENAIALQLTDFSR
jgi:phosphoribosylformylglycinamidine synthase